MSDQPRLTPTFRGFINDTTDALILFSACLEGVVNHVPRRPHDRERQQLIVSGSVFIYEEHASGIKRWTDGISWSPSRILDNFLIYRELQRPFPPGEKKRALKRRRTGHGVQKPVANNVQTGGTQDVERSLVGSLTDSYDFKDAGLVKKTISINYRGVPHHLVSYYDISDVKYLPVPTGFPQFSHVRIRPELYLNQNFRTPVPGMPLMLHPQLQAPNDPNAAPAAVGHGLYLPVSAPVSVTPPAPTITPEQVYTQALAAEMAVTTADPTYTTANWLPGLYVAADAPVHGEVQGHNLPHQYQMQQHTELQHQNHAQFQQQQLQQHQLQQQQQLLNMHQQQLQPSPVQHNHQLQPSPLQAHHQFLPSPMHHQQPVPEILQRRRRHHAALEYDRPQSQQPQPQHLFQSQQRHDEHRDSYQPILMQHNQNDMSFGGDQPNTANAAQYTSEEWSTWFEHQAPI